MQFWHSLALTEMDELIELAKVAEDVGFTGITLSDRLATLRAIQTGDPRADSTDSTHSTDDGKRMRAGGGAFPDPWILIASLAQETSKLRFMPCDFVLPLRDPFSVAKLIASAAVLSKDRVVLGAGTGWVEEEFALVDRPFDRLSERVDEMLEVIAKLHSGELVDHAGEFFPFEGVQMAPAPQRPVEVRIGGRDRVALRRAARHDGWLGVNHSPEELVEIIAFLEAERGALGRADRAFDVMITLDSSADLSGSDRGEFERYRDVGVHSIHVPSWGARSADSVSFEEKQRSLEEFAERYIVPLGD